MTVTTINSLKRRNKTFQWHNRFAKYVAAIFIAAVCIYEMMNYLASTFSEHQPGVVALFARDYRRQNGRWPSSKGQLYEWLKRTEQNALNNDLKVTQSTFELNISKDGSLIILMESQVWGFKSKKSLLLRN